MNIQTVKYLEYKELENLLIEELEKVKNLKQLSDKLNITKSQYIKISQIRNHKNVKKYTDLVISLLALFDYKVDNQDHYLVIKYDKPQNKKKKAVTLTGS